MSNRRRRKGILFVVSAPSGAGKTTLARITKEAVSNIYPSISHTTRKPRSEEVDGKDYHFVSKETFKKMVEAGEFLEWAEIFNNFYGTSIHNLNLVEKQGRDLLLVIDVQGAEQLRKLHENGCYIFILPPSLKDLEKRIRDRGLDPEEAIIKRIKSAPDEIAHFRNYDYIIINDNLDEAANQLKSIIFAERCRYPNFMPDFPDMLLSSHDK